MSRITRHLAPAAIAVITIVGTTAVHADDGDSQGEQNRYVVTPLVSDFGWQSQVPGPGAAEFVGCRLFACR